MEDNMQRYVKDLITGYTKSDDEDWDAVIITSRDSGQKQCYKKQLRVKLERKELPSHIRFTVLSDPEGPVIGAGGATLYVLQHLKAAYGEGCFAKRVLVIHAGGFSKRLPQCSCTGKLFSLVPMTTGGAQLCLLYLKLILTRPFVKCMRKGGIFILGSDHIETYSLDGLDLVERQLKNDGFVAIAHPSPVAIGETHGVYVVAESGESSSCWVGTCLEVLQKPSRSLMEVKGALRNSGDGEKVYTDSMLWCGPELMRKLLDLAEEYPAVFSSETCIYGDFLACLGQRPLAEKIYWNRAAEQCPVRREIARRFHDTPLELLVLEQSKFYHLGTLQEYAEHLRPGSEFFGVLGMQKVVNCWLSGGSAIGGVAMNSALLDDVRSGAGSVIENCIVSRPIGVGAGAILSNCFIDDPVDVPADWLFHTVPIGGDSVRYVTLALAVADDLKGLWSQSRSWNKLQRSADCPLWSAKLFPAAATMTGSFYSTWRLVRGDCDCDVADSAADRFSLADLIRLKHIESFMEHGETIAKLLES